MISVYLVVFLTVYQTSAFNANNVIRNTELEFAFLTHRHGDRTPVPSGLPVAMSEKMLDLITPWGYGQLTDAGKRTGYKTGEFIRRRYGELLSPKYNNSEIYIRSTDSKRTQMTVLTAMAAVYPATVNNWSENINWDPVPYTTVPAKYDFNTAFVNCPKLTSYSNAAFVQPSPRMDKYSGVLAKVSDALGFDFTKVPNLAYAIYDLLVSERNLGFDIGKELTELMPELRLAANEAMDVIYGNDDYIALQAGVLLNEFFKYAKQITNGTNAQRVRVYSAHDINVYSLESVSQVKHRQGVPEFGSVFSLELRRMVKTARVPSIAVRDRNLSSRKKLRSSLWSRQIP
ncbi:prostatic acid phosphatase-like isoform X2 [Hyposmocoma kahamanoa]|uniref:prostatic acid phosphatase-like isoform X2 n=1 Tax=Hyposmocoma kahamanoa TaxID=1477025 RepID=UPI000E6D6444|nr:prostatic acid phosphatase-like isoform X2 [Hyposmocoma kahamanoa]